MEKSGFEKRFQDLPMERGDLPVEGKGLSSARKALIKSLMVLGMAGFWANASKMEAQNAGNHPDIQHVEQKEGMKPDFFRVNQLAKDYATMLFHTDITPTERHQRTEKMSEEYGPGADKFIADRFGEKERTEELPAGSDNQKGTLANFLDKQALIDDVLFDPELPQLISANKQGGYIVKQVELNGGQKTYALIEYAYMSPDVGAIEATGLIQAEIDAVEKSVSGDPALAKKFEWGKKLFFRIFIKGGSQNPGWYDVEARTEKEDDPRALVVY